MWTSFKISNLRTRTADLSDDFLQLLHGLLCLTRPAMEPIFFFVILRNHHKLSVEKKNNIAWYLWISAQRSGSRSLEHASLWHICKPPPDKYTDIVWIILKILRQQPVPFCLWWSLHPTRRCTCSTPWLPPGHRQVLCIDLTTAEVRAFISVTEGVDLPNTRNHLRSAIRLCQTCQDLN